MKQVNRTRSHLDLLNWPVIGWFFTNSTLMLAVRLIVLAMLGSAIYFGLVYPTEDVNPYTGALFWSLFWPFFLIVSMATLGTVFCGICPHSFVGKYLNRLGPKKPLPGWLKNRWIGFGLLLLAYWVPIYIFPDVLKTPWISALFFLVLTLFAWGMFYRYRNMAYCSSLCPIGTVTSAFSKVGFAQLKTDQNHCQSCRSFDCTKACEWNLRPYFFEKKNSMGDCTLCMDCAQACNAVELKLTPPSAQLWKPIKAKEPINVWVYVWLLAVISITMRFHHSLGHSAIKEQLPWVQAGQWLESLMPIPVLDWVGVMALTMAVISTFAIVWGSFFVSAKLIKMPVKDYFQSVGQFMAPLMLIGAISHIGSFFFLHYASDLTNAWYWLIGSATTMEPLATFRDSWVHLFGLFNYVAVIWALFVLHKRLGMLSISGKQRLTLWLISGGIVWFYLFLVIFRAMIPSGH
ncbi:MAG: 4Fe-4S binding protein [Hydrogenovibrio sp.]|uniref:4Fe-4S binding protein n=1 Tax=Hydrogenovibrio sp. TaxID=2065821 RepID=UPI0028709704|nr:4Fe-4S binding protein [Hydrogenovibrio sp.]MDR9498843.1 4Fe-4S binding protein [Hydrogenovibrio sp.]